MIYVSLAFPDQVNSPLVERIEVAGGITNLATPLETKPFHIILNAVDVLLLFLFRIGVVKTQDYIGRRTFRQGQSSDRWMLRAPHAESIRLRRETGMDRSYYTFGQIFLDDLFQKVTWFVCCAHCNQYLGRVTPDYSLFQYSLHDSIDHHITLLSQYAVSSMSSLTASSS